MSETCDLAILGGGCAGLSLARELAACRYSKRVLIIEPRTRYEHDRTWCFWAEAEHGLSEMVSKQWRQWHITTANRAINHTGGRLAYQQIRSGDFYQASCKMIARAPNIELRQGLRVERVFEIESQVVFETESGRIAAALVIDTRPRTPQQDTAMLWQLFSGGDVESEQACFNPSTAELMQQMTSDATGLKFTYILPMTPHRALVQTTRFALTRYPPEKLDGEFKTDLNRLVKGCVKLQRWERGCLPMGQAQQRARLSARVVCAGQAAGALRASSGYGFLRIQAWARTTAKELARGRIPLARPFASRLERKMDAIFLKALVRSPGAAADWFADIAATLSGDEFGRFMSQSPSLGLWLKVVSALPKAPFLCAIFARTP